MSLSRREFLLAGWALALGATTISRLSSCSLIPEGRVTWNPKKPLPPFLQEEVGFLWNGKKVELFWETIRDIDSEITILPTNTESKLKGNILKIKEWLTYADIPALLCSITGREEGASTSSWKIAGFSRKYREKGLLLAQNARETTDTEIRPLLEDMSLHYFLVANLFEGKTMDESALEEFKKKYLESTEPYLISTQSWTEMDDIMQELGKEDFVRSIPFSLSWKEQSALVEAFKKAPSEWLVSFLWRTEQFTRQNYPTKEDLFPLIRTVVVTTYKTQEVFSDLKEIASNGELFGILYQKTQELLKQENEKQNTTKIARIHELQTTIERDIQKEIARDFESALYYRMMDDFILKDDLRKAVVESFQNMQENLTINGYLSTLEAEIPKNQRKDFLKLKEMLIEEPNSAAETIEKICEILPKEITGKIRRFCSYLASPEFHSLKSFLGRWDFTSVKRELSTLRGEERKMTLFILMSISGFYVNALGRGGSSIEGNGNYETERFELTNLKTRNTKYNCMSMSALNNYVLEELFWLTGLGVNFVKYQGDIKSHHTNAINTRDGEILISDITNNQYFFIRNDGLDPDYTYDIDRYSNAYMTGAYFNIHGKYARRYFENPFYRAYTNLTGQGYFQYITELQKAGKNNKYTRAIRERMYNEMQ